MKVRCYEVHPGDPFRFNIHETAKKMVADGFFGQGMYNPEKSEEYILLAADDPDVESKLPVSGFSFWESCEWSWRVWKARQRFGRPPNRYKTQGLGPRAPSPATAKRP